ncbi:MAG: gliding motility-associated C-terminal domain-containing protein, partial [Cyclobacteriaceae bacterium]
CGHIRERPYEVIVKISDNPPAGPSLVNFATWRITVVGPAPTGVEATTVNSKEINVSWDKYTCQQADSIQVWRRVDSFEFEVDDCQLGMPPSAGYELIDLVDASDTDYLDNNQGIGLAAGATYCYRLVATFPRPGGGLSYVSEEACDSLEAVRPVITNVDVDQTGLEDGEIIVKWLPPFDIDKSIVPEPFEYEIIRSEPGAAKVSLGRTTDLTITDTGLNTMNNIYSYEILMRDGNGVAIDTSSIASSVRLEPTPLFKSIELRWTADVPWSIRSQEYPYHYIYRNNVSGEIATDLVLIDSVDVNANNLFYLDDGRFEESELDEDTEYCYYVSTNGVYGNIDIDEPLINRSQVICSRPNDIIPPCTPIAFSFDQEFDCEQQIVNKACSFADYTNHLVWDEDVREGCDDDIVSYNVYFSAEQSEVDEDFELIANVTATEFFHENLSSLKGCYRIRSVDRSGNLSEPSEIICTDNCPNYELPNTFSPNGDGLNDFFTPFYEPFSRPIVDFDRSRCPRFVEKVVFTVFDRTGNELFVYNSDENPENNILINWDGTTANGNTLPTGTYFYTAEVTFDRLNPADELQQFKGWIQLFR